LDENIATEGGVDPMIPIDECITKPADYQSLTQDIILHHRECSQELDHPEFGRLSKVYTR
jgi:hypothetical protein